MRHVLQKVVCQWVKKRRQVSVIWASIVLRLRTGWRRILFLIPGRRKRFFPASKLALGAHLASFPIHQSGKAARAWNETTQLHVLPKLQTCGALPQLRHTSSLRTGISWCDHITAVSSENNRWGMLCHVEVLKIGTSIVEEHTSFFFFKVGLRVQQGKTGTCYRVTHAVQYSTDKTVPVRDISLYFFAL